MVQIMCVCRNLENASFIHELNKETQQGNSAGRGNGENSGDSGGAGIYYLGMPCRQSGSVGFFVKFIS